MAKQGTVYLICDPVNSLYKIGVTTGSPSKRLKKLQTGNGTELFFVHLHVSDYPFRVEKMLHNRFYAQNELNEWFALSDDDVMHFSEHCAEVERIIESLKENPFFMRDIH